MNIIEAGWTAAPIMKGDIGIEIELEYEQEYNPYDMEHPGWVMKDEGSIRGRSGEFVLKTPCAVDKVRMYLDRVYKVINKLEPYDSKNCSIHVHINVQKMEVDKLINFLCLYFILEPILINSYCDIHRDGNTFCMKGIDAEDQYDLLYNIATNFRNRPRRDLNRDAYKYGAANLAAIVDYGSVEFRSLHFTTDVDHIQAWIDVLLKIKTAAEELENREDILLRFSELGVEDYVESIIGKTEIPEHIEEEVLESMYRVQPTVYCKPIKPKLTDTDTGGQDYDDDLLDALKDNVKDFVHLKKIYETLDDIAYMQWRKKMGRPKDNQANRLSWAKSYKNYVNLTKDHRLKDYINNVIFIIESDPTKTALLERRRMHAYVATRIKQVDKDIEYLQKRIKQQRDKAANVGRVDNLFKEAVIEIPLNDRL